MHPPYGEKPRGLLVFYADKRMMSVLCDGRSELPDGETVREYNSYCGNYEYDGKTLVTHVDASADPETRRRRPNPLHPFRRRPCWC